jgi:hypothetical protein
MYVLNSSGPGSGLELKTRICEEERNINRCDIVFGNKDGRISNIVACGGDSTSLSVVWNSDSMENAGNCGIVEVGVEESAFRTCFVLVAAEPPMRSRCSGTRDWLLLESRATEDGNSFWKLTVRGFQ